MNGLVASGEFGSAGTKMHLVFVFSFLELSFLMSCVLPPYGKFLPYYSLGRRQIAQNTALGIPVYTSELNFNPLHFVEDVSLQERAMLMSTSLPLARK